MVKKEVSRRLLKQLWTKTDKKVSIQTPNNHSGYTGQNFANEISSLTSAKVIVVKRNELHQFSVIPQRWLIERSFSWLGNYHRLWRNCERKLNTSLMMVSLAFIRLLLKRY